MELFKVYQLWPIEPVKGRGCTVWDKDGNEYLDLYGGHAVISIGHSHPLYCKMIEEQIEKIGFYSNAVQNSLQVKLAEQLGKLSGYDDYSLFLCNSGAEANENAMKLASFHTGKERIIALQKSFHGRTSGAVAATDNPKIQSPFNKTDHITFVRMNNLAEAEAEFAKGDCAAIIIEGIQGVAGIFEPDAEYLKGIRALCDKYNVVLIFDEVQSGYGRTGNFFAHQHSDVKGDIITTAKGMANGFPIGGIIISPMFEAVSGMLGTTFGGSHLACAAALAVLKVIEDESLIDNAKNMGDYLVSRLDGNKAIKEIRGRGLMIGLEMHPEYQDLRNRLLSEKKIFTGGAGKNVIRLLPPLCIDKETADRFVSAFNELTN